ncbi:MAG: CotH kinase family protein [Verrucomicrobiales bacterium]|nr:CotH kinase family protein [Verrucomicrobiales bacterium]
MSMVLWVALVAMATLRFMFPPARVERPGRDFMGGGGGEWRGGGRWNRGDQDIRPAKGPVPGDLWRIQIEIQPSDADKLRSYWWDGWNGGGGNQRPEVPATIREGDTVYTNVAVHLKGSAGSFQAFDQRPALTLNFSKNAKGQKFHGFSKISLNNSRQDPSRISEIICRELFDAAGVPVPRADHATVILNGRDLGLYVLTEGWGKPFLKRYFTNADGNLYDGGFVQDVNGNMQVNSGEHQEDRSDLKRLIAAAKEPDRGKRWERLNEVLDVERFATFLALEVMTCHWDGYALNRNNYRAFHDLASDKFVFMPHGMDQMFGWARSSPNATIDPGMEGLVARAFVGTTNGHRMFRDRIAMLRTNLFDEVRLTNRVMEINRRIRPTLEAYGEDWAQAQDMAAIELCRRIEERARSITEQLGSPKEPLQFDPGGAVLLTGWKPRVTTQERRPISFDRDEGNGSKALHITMARSGGAGSWRTRVLLDPGEYRLEGRARTTGVEGAGGVCLRISGSRSQSRAAEGDWQEFHFDFEVSEPMSEIELICELESRRGEAWFEESSLRLVRRN